MNRNNFLHKIRLTVNSKKDTHLNSIKNERGYPENLSLLSRTLDSVCESEAAGLGGMSPEWAGNKGSTTEPISTHKATCLGYI